jgi:hypothetical protein
MATTKNLTVDQGASFIAYAQYLDIAKTPISLIGYDVQAKLKKSYYSANSVSFVTVLANGANGNISISLTAAQTANLDGRYVYDITANTANTTIRIQEGIVTVNLGVTR